MKTRNGLTRRDALKLGGIATIGALGSTMLGGCAPQESQPISERATSFGSDEVPSFLVKPEEITDFSEVHEFDVVVVGAGESGLSAVHSALKAGANVACVQNNATATTTGNMAAWVDLDNNDEASIQACLSFIDWKNDYRSNRDLVSVWAYNSQEALNWWAQEAAEGGVEAVVYDWSLPYHGYDIALHANTYFHVPGNHNAAALVIAERLESQGANFFYSTPCVQLKTENGAVRGAICKKEDGTYALFNAKKGVILASGDYTSNEEMRNYYAPDIRGFVPKAYFRDGSGMCAGMHAGAIMTPVNHTKMIHGDPATTRLEMPFLFVDSHGQRFMDESCPRMGYMNSRMRKYVEQTDYRDYTAMFYFVVVPGNWRDFYEGWKADAPYDIAISNGGRFVNPDNWISGNTVEELAENMVAYAEKNGYAMDFDAQTVVETINRYNEVCKTGRDADFGKETRYLAPIDNGPYYAVPRHSEQISAILGGLVVNENHQCVDKHHQPIEGLYAVGNASGQFFGGVDYPMDIEGLSIGRAITSGFVAGKHVANL